LRIDGGNRNALSEWTPEKSTRLPFGRAPQYQPGMNLTREQAAALGERIGPMVAYLARVRERMTRVGFPVADPLYQSVMRAENALRDITVKLHYMSCAGGVGRPRDEQK